MPSWEQLERAEDAVKRFRERVGPRSTCCGCCPTTSRTCPSRAWAAGARRRWWSLRTATCCRARPPRRIPGLEFANVRDHPLAWIWNESDAFARFRGTEWMQEPCRTCPLGRQEDGLRRLPLSGAAAHGRRRGDRSRLPVLASSRPRRPSARCGADRRARLPHDEAHRARLSVRAPVPAGRPGRCGATRAPRRASRRP